MGNTTTSVNPNVNISIEDNDAVVVKDLGWAIVESVKFDAKAKAEGFSYCRIKVKGTQTAIAEAVTKYGAEAVAGMISTALGGQLRNKAMNELPKEASEIKARLTNGQTCLLSEEDALSHIPGVRELTPDVLLRKAKEAKKAMAKAIAEGKMEEAATFKRETVRYMAEANRLLQKQISEGLV